MRLAKAFDQTPQYWMNLQATPLLRISAGQQDPVATGAAWGVGELGRLAALGLTKRKAGQLQARVRSGDMSLIPGARLRLRLLLKLGGNEINIFWRSR